MNHPPLTPPVKGGETGKGNPYITELKLRIGQAELFAIQQSAT